MDQTGGKAMAQYMAIDQYGHTFHDLGPHPRKALMDRIGRRTASRMFVDAADGEAVHIGWIVGTHWLTVYEVQRMARRR